MVGLTTVGMLVHGVDPYCLASRLCLMLRPLAVMGAVGSCVDCLLVSETARALMPHWWMGKRSGYKLLWASDLHN